MPNNEMMFDVRSPMIDVVVTIKIGQSNRRSLRIDSSSTYILPIKSIFKILYQSG